jgi:uncharacterized alpha-E superfamily protein
MSAATYFRWRASVVPIRIVRNLMMRKGRPPRPIRVCTKKLGPGVSSLMASAITRIAGAMRRRTIALTSRSRTRFATS